MKETNMLIEGCRKGEESSWRQLFEAYYPLAKWVVEHTIYQIGTQDVDSLAQDGMIALVENIDRITDEQHLKRFLKRATRNKCIDFIRKNRQHFNEVDAEIMEVGQEEYPEAAVDALANAMKELREPCKTMIKARFLDGLSYKEMSQRTNIKTEQVGTRLSRCLRFLRNLLEGSGISWEDML